MSHNNKYHTLNTYEGFCTYNVNNNVEYYIPNFPSKIKENFGSFSLSAAVRYPYSLSRLDPSYKQPKLEGVN